MYTLKLERVLLIVLLKNVLLTAGQQTGNPEKPTHGLCEPITIPICQGIGYNQTIMPNILGHETQTDAGFEVTVYHPLVSIKCSPHLRLFLCALYLPVCTILTEPVPPCRSVCIAARDGCSGTMNRFGHDWPEHMACEKFPELPELCVGPNETTTNNQPTNSYPSHGQPNGGQPNGGQSTNHQSFNGEGVAPNTPNYNKNNFWNPLQPQQTLPTLHNPQIVAGDETRNTLLPPQKSVISGVCPLTWRTEPKLKYKLQLTQLKGYEMEDCGLPCKGVLFDENNETLARYWIGVWAILCFVSTLFTVLTFLIDMDRFSYPERPIIFISGCYLIVSICYIVGFILEDKASCITASGGELVVTQGTKNEGCTILFMLTYFFTMASSIWWVILTLTWVLAAGLKWGHEAIESNSQYFHLAAWAVPAIKTITIIALRSIDGDVLSGVCFTGLSDETSLIGYIIAPLVAYLTLGTIFLVAGFISLFHIRNAIKHTGTKTNKLEKLMVRIGVFSVLYTVPAIIVIVCNVYELLNRGHWLEQYQARICDDPEFKGLLTCPLHKDLLQESRGPDFIWFMFKYLGYLIVGITSGFWIWSNKTMSSWSKFFRRLGCCCGREPQEAAV